MDNTHFADENISNKKLLIIVNNIYRRPQLSPGSVMGNKGGIHHTILPAS